MSTTSRIIKCPTSIRVHTLISLAAVAGFISTNLSAQTALGTPFIGKNHLAFYSSELTRSGGPETTTMFGAVYGRRFGMVDRPTQLSFVLRGTARPFDAANAGVWISRRTWV